MLNTNIFISNSENPFKFERISGNGLALCVWELEVINHERLSWTNNVLKQYSMPKYKKYSVDVINIKI